MAIVLMTLQAKVATTVPRTSGIYLSPSLHPLAFLNRLPKWSRQSYLGTPNAELHPFSFLLSLSSLSYSLLSRILIVTFSILPLWMLFRQEKKEFSISLCFPDNCFFLSFSASLHLLALFHLRQNPSGYCVCAISTNSFVDTRKYLFSCPKNGE